MVIAVIEAEDDRKPIALIIITVITISITLYLLLLLLLGGGQCGIHALFALPLDGFLDGCPGFLIGGNSSSSDLL